MEQFIWPGLVWITGWLYACGDLFQYIRQVNKANPNHAVSARIQINAVVILIAGWPMYLGYVRRDK